MTVAAEKAAAEGAALFRSYSGFQPCTSENPPESGQEPCQGGAETPRPDLEHLAPPRHRWLDAVQASTADFRKRKAEALLERAAEVAGEGALRVLGVESLTDEGFRFCPLPPDDVRDQQPWEHWSPGKVEVARCDVTWWTTRAEALRVKVERVKGCGTKQLTHACDECGTVHESVIRCRDFRLCLHCRNARLLEYQSRFETAHQATHEANRKAGRHKALARHGYKWSARFITLTLPHSGVLKDDLAQLPTAWPKFLQRLRQHFIKDRFYPHERGPECTDRTCTKCMLARELAKEVKYVRVLEVTPGGNGKEADADLREAEGHAHMHLYLYGPFIERDLIAHWWGKSLEEAYRMKVPTIARAELLDTIEDPKRRARLEALLVTRRGPQGKPLDVVLKPVVDVRACKGSPRDIAKELAKYLVKDGERDRATGELVHVDPEWFATAYEALYSRRSIAASRRFWLLDPPEPRSCFCQDCGSPFVHSLIEPVPEPRGPPF